jgi:phosphoribosylanthranilate isomerase
VFVKICGVTNEEDALLAVALGADAVGFVLAPSPRQVSLSTAADIAKRLPRDTLTVGVFRDEAPERVARLVNTSGLRAAQLHGHESPEAVAWVSERVPFTIKAIPAGHPDLRRAGDYAADAVMIDSPSPGSGELFDWRLAEGAVHSSRLLLAGGLDPRNVSGAIAQVRPWGVDVSSGVESSPGRKDPRMVRAFVTAARSAAPPAYQGRGAAPYDWQDDA